MPGRWWVEADGRFGLEGEFSHRGHLGWEERGVTGWQPGEAGVGAGAMARISEGRMMDLGILADMTRDGGGFGLWIMEIGSSKKERGSHTF
jgi:hypothetical protein